MCFVLYINNFVYSNIISYITEKWNNVVSMVDNWSAVRKMWMKAFQADWFIYPFWLLNTYHSRLPAINNIGNNLYDDM